MISVEAVENPYYRCWEMLKTVKNFSKGGGGWTPKTPGQHVWLSTYENLSGAGIKIKTLYMELLP